MELTGPERPVLDRASGLAVSASGTAVYTDNVTGSLNGRLFLMDGRTAPEPLRLPSQFYRGVQFGPEGRRLLFGDQRNGAITVLDLALGSVTRVLPEGWTGWDPIWSPDGDSVVFHTLRPGTFEFDGFVTTPDGRGTPRQLFRDTSLTAPQAWLSGGRMVIRGLLPEHRSRLEASDLFVMTSAAGSARVQSYLGADWDESHAAVSPDEHWLAYQSDESGTLNVYVRPFPDAAGGQWKISNQEGYDPVWSRDGRRLYFWEGFQLRAATVRTEPAFEVVRRETILTDSTYLRSCCFPNYAPHPDGKRFVMARRNPVDLTAAPGFIIVTNWAREIERLMAAPGR